ncbi:MAG: endonuclease MutS2 [Thermosynechococcaceae cyanobacterium]
MPAKTLALLEWPRLCQHLSTFAATKLGVAAALSLEVPPQPSVSQTLLNQTQEIYDLENLRLTPLVFNGIHDIRASLERAEKQGVLSGEELLQLATTLSGTRQLRRMIDRQPDLAELNGLVADLRTYPELEQEIHHCIDDRGEVADRASDKLMGIRQKQRQTHSDIHKILQRILNNKAGALQEQLITQRSDRFVIPVKAPQKDAVPGIVHDTSTSGVTLYIEPQSTVNLNNQLRQLKRRAEVESETIRRRLTEQVAEVQADLEQLVMIVTALDLATARARYSYWLGGNRPRFVGAGETLTLRKLRHPLLVWQQNHEQGEAVVPIDVVISPQIKVVAITGPNTGGKTVTLKTLGLAFLMAKVGLFVPAQEPVELPWFDQVLADIGDEQSLQQSLSTFSGHIRRIQSIIESLTDQSLVLLDEVGAGTDPLEGSALAIALLQYLADSAQLTVATTHFGELKALKYQDARFENASVEFNDQTLAPTYRLLWGIPGRSNALIIAKRLGFRESILDQAQQSLGGQTQEVNEVIAGLEDQRRQQEQKAQDAARLLQSTEQLHRQVSDKASELKTRERELKQQQERAIQHEINVARKEIAKVIRQLQQGPQTAQAAQEATDKLGTVGQQRLPSGRPKVKAKAPTFKPQVGDRVRIPSIGQKAEVIALAPNEDEITVRFGLMKMTIEVTEIESLTGEKVEPKPKPAPPPPPPKPITVRTSDNTIDLRGSRVADAEQVLEDAIAQAHGPLWIIHGHGTGKLRNGVQAYLKQNNRVERFEFAEQSEGGTGVTIAHCKV